MSARALVVARPDRSRRICWVLLLVGYVALYPVQRRIDLESGTFHEVNEVLYLPSGETLRRLSLGHEGLLADIYWTRVVQYFGRKRTIHSSHFELLGPLLRLTT